GDEDGEFELEDVIHPDTSSPVKQGNDVVQEIEFPKHADENNNPVSNISNMPNNPGVDSNISSQSVSDDLANTDKMTDSSSQNKSINLSSSVTPDKNNNTSDDIVCTICRDGRSPKNNRIVLCDKCDIPYHQQCHKPPIESRVVEITDAEWMCAKCEEALRGRKRRKVDSSNTSSGSISVSSDIFRGSSGNGLTEEQKVAYLSSLPQRVLIDLILIAEKLHPDLPLYPADIKEKIANNAHAITSTSNQNPSSVDDRQTPALQKAVKKERILRIGTVYKLNSNYKPVKRPQDPEENQPFKGISSDNDNPDHNSQNGIYEIAVRMSNTDNFSSVQMDTDDHPSLSSSAVSAVSTPIPNVVSNGHTA
ncbi:9143_t:CDS:2, partial [Racocetra fulgida]